MNWEIGTDMYTRLGIKQITNENLGFPGGSVDQEFPCNVGDLDWIPGLERNPGGGHGNPLQYSCLENPHGQGAWGAAVGGVAKSQTRPSD